MSKSTEIPMGDDELAELMAELEEETAGVVSTPVEKPAPTAAKELGQAALDRLNSVIDGPKVEKIVVADETSGEEVVIAESDPSRVDASDLEIDPVPDKSQKDDLPRVEDPVGKEKSNFVLPPKMRGDQPPEGRTDTPEEVAATAPARHLSVVKSEPGEPEPAKVDPRPPAAGLKHFVSAAQVEADTAVSDTTMDNCIMQQAGLYARYGAMVAEAEAQAAKAKLLCTAKEAECFAGYRTKLLAAGEKATEAVINSYVVRDKVYLAAKQRQIEAEQIAGMVKAAAEALRQKRDMLIQMGADRREDGKGSMRMMHRPGAGV